MRKHGSKGESARLLSESRQTVLDSAFGETRLDSPAGESAGRDATRVASSRVDHGRIDSGRIDSGHFSRPVCVGQPHGVELAVQRQLLGHPGLKFSSLVIRRVRDGVCLEGFVEGGEELTDVCRLARTVDGVNQVLNHLVVRQPAKN